MLRRIVICLIVAMAGMTFAGMAAARQRHQINPTPFSHAPCSVLDGQPCTPSYCSVFNHGPCIPEIDYPYGENLQLTIQAVPAKEDEDKYRRPDPAPEGMGALFAAWRPCGPPPPPDRAGGGMKLWVRLI